MSTTDYLVTTTTANAALEKHAKFWDRKNKGYITPVDAMFGFIHLGYGVIFSVTVGTFLGILFSYATQDSWVPDPLCRTRMENLLKNTQRPPYDQDGQFDLELFDQLFSKYAKSDISGKTITLKELLEWNEATYKDPLAWSTNALEWLATYLLVGNKGILKREDIQAAYDGTLFYRIRERNKQHRTIQNNNNMDELNLNVSGLMVPKSYVRQLETQLNNVINVLPRSTVLTLETRLRNWLSFVQQRQQKAQPILKGVSTPAARRRRHHLFENDHCGNENDDDVDGRSSERSISPILKGGLTGAMSINLLDHSMPLTGVQGYYNDEVLNDDDEEDEFSNHHYGMHITGVKSSMVGDDIGDDDYNYGDELASSSMSTSLSSYSITGVRPEGEDYYRDTPHIDWLRSGPLTGVSPSTSTTTHFMPLEETIILEEEEEVNEDGTTLAFSMTGIQHTPTSPPPTDIEEDEIRQQKKEKEPQRAKQLPTTPTDSEASEDKYEKEDEEENQKKPVKSVLEASETPSFTSNQDDEEEEEEEEDSPVSPGDSNHKANDPIKRTYSRPSWPSLTEVVPTDN